MDRTYLKLSGAKLEPWRLSVHAKLILAAILVCAEVIVLASAGSAQAYIYWTNLGSSLSGTTIGRANDDGTDVNQQWITGADSPLGLAVNGNYIYWTNDNGGNCDGSSIARANLDGTGANQDFITGVDCAHGLALNDNSIFWANRDDGGGTTIGAANLDGTDPNENFITGAQGPHDVAVDGTYIYWSNYNSGTIGRADLDGSDVNQNFITGASDPAGLAVTPDYIYWANNGGTTIGRADIDGSDVNQDFISGADNPLGVTIYGSEIYWTNYGASNASAGGGSIGQANVDGTDVNQNFITGADSPAYVVVDGLSPENPPTEITPPKVVGTPLPGNTLTCNPGTWTGNPTFTYSWQLSASTIPGATNNTYVVTILDEGQTITCIVGASNGAGVATPAATPGSIVAMPGTLTCKKPSGSLSGSRIGPLTLGMTRARARAILKRYTVIGYGFDAFCLYGGWGIRADYQSNRIVWMLTANPFYRAGGVSPGLPLADASKRLRIGKEIVVGPNDWYFAISRSASYIFKVRKGIIQEVGIVLPALAYTRQAQRKLVGDFKTA